MINTVPAEAKKKSMAATTKFGRGSGFATEHDPQQIKLCGTHGTGKKKAASKIIVVDIGVPDLIRGVPSRGIVLRRTTSSYWKMRGRGIANTRNGE